MARDVQIEARLQRWAQWVSVGDGSGYPVMSVLHQNWQPPSPGQSPIMKTAAPNDARVTHRIIGRMSARLQDTLVLHYVKNLPLAVQAEQLACAPSTVTARIDRAHQLLQMEL